MKYKYRARLQGMKAARTRMRKQLVDRKFTFIRIVLLKLAHLRDQESAFRDQEVCPPLTDGCVICNVQLRNNQSDTPLGHGDY